MPSKNKSRVFKPPALEPLPNPYPTASNAPTPLGTLSILPRELRDQIYGHVHSVLYHIINSSEPNLIWGSVGQRGYGLPMLTLSKAIRQECLAALFKKAVFMLDNVGYAGKAVRKPKDIPFIDQILNVKYVVFLLEPNDMPEGIAKPVEFFSGTEVLRNRCSVQLYLGSTIGMLSVQSPLIIAIKGLTGFKIVTLHSRSCGGGFAREFGDNTDALRSALEPSLGPSIIREDWENGVPWELTFRPRDYIAKRDRAKTVSSKLGDEENGSLPQVGNS